MQLYIDTSDNKKTIVMLDKFKLVKRYSNPSAQRLLKVINQALKSQNKTLKDLKSIKVALGPGSFTGLRVGASVANALSFALKIPVNGKLIPVIPQYGKEPNISQPRKI